MTFLRGSQSVCRSLFGPVDHTELRWDLELKLWEIMEQDSRRWNFNFQSETPLPGRFQWEEMPTDSAAAFYHESAQMKDGVSSPKAEDDSKLSICEQSPGTDRENRSSIPNTPMCPAEEMPVRKKRAVCKLTSELTITRITDFFTQKRRTAETKNIWNPLYSSSNEAQCKKIKMSMHL